MDDQGSRDGQTPQDALPLAATVQDADVSSDRIGDTLVRKGDVLGRYVVLEKIGEGGVGTVVAAYDEELDRKVALKLLPIGAFAGTDGGGARARLRREARAMAKLSHPNVVSVYEVGETHRQPFIAMELAEQGTLRDWLRESPDHGPKEVLEKFLQAGRGLVAAHRLGLVHRDFKPGNVLLDAEGRCKVADFGLVGLPGGQDDDGSSGNLELTRSGTIVGTPAYMAPEQFLRERVDDKADQYAFATALYEGLYGKRPYEAESFDELSRLVCSGEWSGATGSTTFDKRLRVVFEKALSRKASDRFASMDALLSALEWATGRARPRRRLPLWVPALIAGLISMALLWAMFARSESNVTIHSTSEGGRKFAKAQLALDVAVEMLSTAHSDEERRQAVDMVEVASRRVSFLLSELERRIGDKSGQEHRFANSPEVQASLAALTGSLTAVERDASAGEPEQALFTVESASAEHKRQVRQLIRAYDARWGQKPRTFVSKWGVLLAVISLVLAAIVLLLRRRRRSDS